MARSRTPQLETYYARRAAEYERIYEKPERQAELVWLRGRIPELLAARRVFETACGTGYWTREIARRAAFVTATDINEPVLDVARGKRLPPGRVRFERADAYSPSAGTRGADAAFAGFWWSHLALPDLRRWLGVMSRHLAQGARLVVLDNRFVPGSSTPISRRDAAGNTYQVRKLLSGETHEILKNFPTHAQLAHAVRPHARAAWVEETPHYWLLVADLT
jgi:demethylmenaquinone methyltransferase/2-methoxy-6-polyprenyl-1,4-benzoquinol methylase